MIWAFWGSIHMAKISARESSRKSSTVHSETCAIFQEDCDSEGIKKLLNKWLENLLEMLLESNFWHFSSQNSWILNSFLAFWIGNGIRVLKRPPFHSMLKLILGKILGRKCELNPSTPIVVLAKCNHSIVRCFIPNWYNTANLTKFVNKLALAGNCR